ncbi:MAG: amino acid ABC transporter substrate-binding protein [Deltaproteobacteria bacterium]|nr:amino acid ABC transporter substrate-binding protein [Deltaproteobacteria bacterium]
MKNNISLAKLVIIFLFLCFSIQTSESAEKEIVMALYIPKNNPTGRFVYLVYTEAFRRLGLKMTYKHIPAKRISLMVDDGLVDGELARIFSYGDQHPNLIRVEEPAFSTSIVAFTINPTIKLEGWNSLRDTEYKVEYMRGEKTSSIKLPVLVPHNNLSIITTWDQGLKKLVIGRIDILVAPELVIRHLLKTSRIEQFLQSKSKESSEIRVAGVFEKISAHAYLHKKHKELAMKLAKILRAMKNEGLIKKYQMTGTD